MVPTGLQVDTLSAGFTEVGIQPVPPGLGA